MPDRCTHPARLLRPISRQDDGSWLCNCHCGGRGVARLHRDGRVERIEDVPQRDAHVHEVGV